MHTGVWNFLPSDKMGEFLSAQKGPPLIESLTIGTAEELRYLIGINIAHAFASASVRL